MRLTSGTTTISDPGGVGTLSGLISGSGGLTLSGSIGSRTFTGPALTDANTYTGLTTLNSGEATISNNRGLGTGTITFNGGGFQVTAPP